MKASPNIVIAGAGSIGCFVGGLLLAAGHSVKFLGRQRIADELNKHGLRLTAYTGLDTKVSRNSFEIDTDPQILSGADIILVCVKSGATEKIAETLLQSCKPDTIVVSMQNGVRNAAILKQNLPELDVRAGMIPFNVVHIGEGRFHQGTSGEIIIESGKPCVASILNCKDLSIKPSDDMESILCGKLLVNLNNALNAISDVPLVEELSNRKWRLKLADQMEEGLAVLKAEGVTPSPPSPVPAWVLPYILRFPTPLFRAAAKQMLAIDPKARSSMWDDLQHGRKTEIDELQGEIIRLGEKHGIPTPVNSSVAQQIQTLQDRT